MPSLQKCLHRSSPLPRTTLDLSSTSWILSLTFRLQSKRCTTRSSPPLSTRRTVRMDRRGLMLDQSTAGWGYRSSNDAGAVAPTSLAPSSSLACRGGQRWLTQTVTVDPIRCHTVSNPSSSGTSPRHLVGFPTLPTRSRSAVESDPK